MKKFDEWNIIKQNIHIKQTQQYVKEGCVYWVSIGQNIGCEVSGKETNFSRPVLVLKRIYIQNYINAFIGIPLTTKHHNGYLFCKLTNVKRNIEVNAMLGQVRTFDSKRIISYYYKAKNEEFEEIKKKFCNLFLPATRLGNLRIYP